MRKVHVIAVPQPLQLGFHIINSEVLIYLLINNISVNAQRRAENCKQENEMLLRSYYICFTLRFCRRSPEQITPPTIENGIAIVDFNF